MQSSDSSKKTVAIVPDKELELVLNEALNHNCIIMMLIATDDIGEDGKNILKHWWKLYNFPTTELPVALENLRSSMIEQVLIHGSTPSGGSGASEEDYNRIQYELSHKAQAYSPNPWYQKKMANKDKRS